MEKAITEEVVMGEVERSRYREEGPGAPRGLLMEEPQQEGSLALDITCCWCKQTGNTYKRYFWRSEKRYHVERKCCGWVEERIWEEGVWI